MRLVCPNCEAQYEVPDEVIPEEGRDVQCSNCNNSWFQLPAGHIPPVAAPEPDPVPDPEPEPEPASELEADPVPQPKRPEATPKRRELDPDVADVLKSEAARETQARQEDAQDFVETQGDLGLQDQPREQVPQAQNLDTDPDPGSRRDMLPDIDEINSSLDTDDDVDQEVFLEDEEDYRSENVRSSRGFWLGFMLILIVVLLLLVLYLFAPQIAEQVPQAEPYLSQYVDFVNGARVWLDEKIKLGLGWLDGLTSETDAPAQSATE